MQSDEADFRKGKAKPIVVFVIIGAVLAAVGALVGFGMQAESETLTPAQAAKEKSRVLTLPSKDQIVEFRQYAAGVGGPFLKEEALKRLAWANDPAGIDLAIAALSDPEQKIRSQAALALTEFGSPAADKAKPALLTALEASGPESAPQIAWALVVLKEASAFERVMTLYRSGALAGVKRLDGGRAFDPDRLMQLVPIERFAELHKDSSDGVRHLVATLLSRAGNEKFQDELVALVQDSNKSVAYQAAPGLGKLGKKSARDPLLAALKGVVGRERRPFLEALRDGMGTPGLVLAFDSVSSETKKREWVQTKQIFSLIDKLADPSGGDALAGYLQTRPHPHWYYRAGLALASIGDLRALEPLARRLRQSAKLIYSDDTDYEQLLKRDGGKERVEAARMIADLAKLHPDKADKIREVTEHALWTWMTQRLTPHANGLRALTAMGSKLHLRKLKEWADPKAPLPVEGQQPPMPREWEIAQSALRYLGLQKDKSTWGILEKQLKRRDPDLDITMDALQGGGVAILGMSLRAAGYGAAEGMSEWGDPRGFKPLMAYIAEPKENEQSREAACAALAWVATDDNMVEIAGKLQEYGADDRADQTRRWCLMETLVQRPVTGTAAALLPLLKSSTDLRLRHQIARAIGKAGLTEYVQDELFTLLKDEALQLDAALALMLGGTQDVAARALASLDASSEAILELQEMWFRTFGYWSTEDLERGHLFRFVDNAVAASRVSLAPEHCRRPQAEGMASRKCTEEDRRGVSQGWVTAQLTRQFENLTIDNGPHSFTRIVLRNKLLEMAKGVDAERSAGAIRTLKFMKEQGSLLALRDAEGKIGQLASKAYHELMNPVAAVGVGKFEKNQ